MKLGIRAIRYIFSSLVSDYSMIIPGSVFNFSSFLAGELRELPFTVETGDFSEKWLYDDNGKYSRIHFSASIRAKKEENRQILQQLEGQKAIFELELISGTKYIIGSPEFIPTFNYSDSVSGQSTSEFDIEIDLQSLHGALFTV